jgi:protein arginine kinase
MHKAELYERVGQWMSGDGQEADVVISSRVRLARNIAGHRFMSRAGAEERRELAIKLRGAVERARVVPDMEYIDLENLPEIDRQLLMERHLISREHAEGEGPRGVAISADETISVMINEEDHLRMQCLRGGLDLDKAWETVQAVDIGIEKEVPYVFDPEFGYLTACPTNVGTAMRVSVMVHLPALAMTRELQRVFAAAAKIDFIVRGLYGEGTQGHGDFFQISNQKTLGRSEKEILGSLTVVIPQIIRYERRVREGMFGEHRRQVEDRIWRAYGILKNARVISSEEALHLLSQLRLGVHLGLVRDLDIPMVHKLFVITRPAHLQKLEARELDPMERDAVRADFLRKSLGAGPMPARG